MTDEKNITPQPSGDGREVISWYVPPERGNEVVRCYVQPQPLPQGVRPQPPQMAPQRGKKRGWIIFVILAAVLATIVGVTALVVSLTDDGDSSTAMPAALWIFPAMRNAIFPRRRRRMASRWSCWPRQTRS